MESREVAPAVRERQLFEQLAKLRHEGEKLRGVAAVSPLDRTRSERLRQIDAEQAATWTGIREARAAGRAEWRARFAGPPLDPFRAMIQDAKKRA
jgi:hypothetical protein